jgi:DNA-binding IclR family transcriptional regulator
MTDPDLGLTGRQPKAVERALRVLEVVARIGPGVSAREVADALGLPPATTYRLLTVLVAEEYVVRLPDLRGFALGRRALDLALRLPEAAAPTDVLAVSRLVSDWARGRPVGVHLATFESGRLAGLRSHDPHQTRPADLSDDELADRPHASAIGKLLLADDPAALLHQASRLHPVTDRTVVDSALLGSQLARVRDEGISWQDGELRAGLLCLAVPLRNARGRLHGALAVSMRGSGPDAGVGPGLRPGPALLELRSLLVRCAASAESC